MRTNMLDYFDDFDTQLTHEEDINFNFNEQQ